MFPMRLLTLCALLLLLLLAAAPEALTAPAAAASTSFGVAAHGYVNIEWWYVNAHVTTDKGRSSRAHWLVLSFWQRAGVPFRPIPATVPRAHYLIYAVTDLDTKDAPVLFAGR